MSSHEVSAPSSDGVSQDQTSSVSDMKVDTVWFHMFCSMVKGGGLKKIGPYATQVYLVIKAHTNLATGVTFPSVATIIEQTGLSKSTVIRSLKRLEHEGYVTKTKRGRCNVYRIVEMLDAYREDGESLPVAFEYVPKKVQKIISEIRAQINEIEVPVYIENLQINLINVNGSIQIGVSQAPKNGK